jgi:hypothetical protein
MLFLTRRFGVTATDADRAPSREAADIAEILERSLALQAKSANEQKRALGRGTHVKGVSVRAQFEVFGVTGGRDAALSQRLAKGIFAKPAIYPTLVRFGNADPKKNSDFKADVRSLSFSVELASDPNIVGGRQDFSMQNATTLPINDSPAFLAIMKVLTASNPAAGLWSLSAKDKLRVFRTLALVQVQAHQTIKPYQNLRYWSTVPFRHGPDESVKHSLTPSPDNLASPLQRKNPNGLRDELIRHVQEDIKMSSFDFAVQFVDPQRMTYWGKHQNNKFWIENASVEWKESEAPFHTIGRLTLLSKSVLEPDDATYIDVTGHSTPDSTPVGSINRARSPAEHASRKARMLK